MDEVIDQTKPVLCCHSDYSSGAAKTRILELHDQSVMSSLWETVESLAKHKT